jgi:hypothetical protein
VCVKQWCSLRETIINHHHHHHLRSVGLSITFQKKIDVVECLAVVLEGPTAIAATQATTTEQEDATTAQEAIATVDTHNTGRITGGGS